MKKFLRGTIAVIAAFALAEALLRLFGLGTTTNSDPSRIVFHHRPGSAIVTINEGYGMRTVNKYGFLDREYSLGRQEPVTRFLLLGNSFSEARQVSTDHAYDNVLEDLLQQQLHKRVEIWDAARSGADLLDNLALYDGIAATVPHAYVLLQLSPRNIFNIRSTGHNTKLVDGTLRTDYGTLEPKGGMHAINQTLKEHSVAWNVLMERAFILRRTFSVAKMFAPSKKKKEGAGEEDNSYEAGLKHPALRKDDTAYFASLINYLANRVGQQHAKLLVFCYTVEQDTAVNKFYTDVCSRNGALYLDLSGNKPLTDTTGPPVAGFMNSHIGFGHLNEYGHRALASALDSCLLPILKKSEEE